MNPVAEKILIALCVALPPLLLAAVLAAYQAPLSLVDWGGLADLGFALTFRFDGLSVLFGVLITGIGFLIQLYSLSYMAGKRDRGMFHLYLTLFMLSMLGLVLAENLILLFVFWELTTLTSFLLIGFTHDQEIARKNAVQAAVVTGSGGLCLLAGLVLLGHLVGSYELSVVLLQGAALAAHPLFPAVLVLLLLGAFTKSAQFPFHFWLPAAMAAPTPVSAYLHSATMVKAGIYLLARFTPVFSGVDLWFWSLLLFGSFTAAWTGVMALRQTDLKLMLAYSTNTILGLLTMLLAFGSDYAVVAAMGLIVAHACYKASLFMVIGNIDKATGTREYNRLAGLAPVLGISLVCAVLAGLSTSGVPPTLGFMAKEYLYSASIAFGPWVTVAPFFASVLMVTVAVIIVRRPFLAKADEHTATGKSIEKKYPLLWIPPLALALLGLLLPVLLLGWLDVRVIGAAASAVKPALGDIHLSLWHGFNLPLLLSGLTLLCGFILAWTYDRYSASLRTSLQLLPVAADVYDGLMCAVREVASRVTSYIQHGSLPLYLLTLFAFLAAVSAYGVVHGGLMHFVQGSLFVDYRQWMLALILLVAAAVVVISPYRLLSIACLGVIGFVTTLVFMLFSAPDVAKTQLLVETLLVVFFVIIMRHMPHLNSVKQHSTGRKLVNFSVAAMAGITVSVILLGITGRPFDTHLSEYFAQQSYPAAHGRNVVNVILVDFRAFDTMGEALVVVVAALAAWAVLRSRAKRRSS